MVLYSDWGPVPATPVDFAAEVQALVLDPSVTTGAELSDLLGQLAIAYADSQIPGGITLQDGPWPAAPNLSDSVQVADDADEAATP